MIKVSKATQVRVEFDTMFTCNNCGRVVEKTVIIDNIEDANDLWHWGAVQPLLDWTIEEIEAVLPKGWEVLQKGEDDEEIFVFCEGCMTGLRKGLL